VRNHVFEEVVRLFAHKTANIAKKPRIYKQQNIVNKPT